MLDNAAANPAFGAEYRDADRTLATKYLHATAKSSNDIANDAQRQAAMDDGKTRDAVMKKVCSGG
ncbi:hypothetical protein ACKUVQ_01885 [Mycobacterium seoulense]|uniref:hypothetical protein n=1 Tax=Mycobacterium seoulense TaxID=386911 RepID=UPI003CECE808